MAWRSAYPVYKEIRGKIMRWLERLELWIVWHLPDWVIYWCLVRSAAITSQRLPNKEMGNLTIFDLMEKPY